MRKKITSIILAVVAFMSFSLFAACDRGTGEQERPFTQRMQVFVATVSRIDTPITLAAEAKIEAGYIVYGFLSEDERTHETIVSSKEKLDGYKTELDALKAAVEEERLAAEETVRVENFLAAVLELPALDKLTVLSRASVDAAYECYNLLSEASKALDSVKTAYATLQEVDEQVAALEEEERMEIVRAAAEAFIEGVEALGKITLDSFEDIDTLLYNYEKFSDEIKNYSGVPEAKEKLDEAYAQYNILKDNDDVEKFLDWIDKIGNVTLESLEPIRNAEVIYTRMSESAKEREEVKEALAVLEDARAKYDVLFAAAEEIRVQNFIEAANKIRTDIENVDISWFDALDAAREAYAALAYESYLRDDVEAAFDRWNTAQAAFDAKGYRQIPMVNPILQGSGDKPTFLVLQYHENMFNALYEFFGVSSTAELAQKAVAWLDVYVDGVYVAKGQLNLASMGHIIHSNEVSTILQALSEEYSQIVSGADFSFAIHFSDVNDEFIPSYKSNIYEPVAGHNYTW